jgi:hypothetical protein
LKHTGIRPLNDRFVSDRHLSNAKILRKDGVARPETLRPEPVKIYDAKIDAENKKEFDEYLEFCTTVMREAPISGG